MENDWIIPGMEDLKALYEEAQGEMALRSYIACLIRLLNGLSQIKASSFHRYENIILVKPMKLFTAYFIDEVQQLLNAKESEVEKKEEYAKDLENAICAIADIYENVINGTANTDKKMFLSLPMNSTLYGISPKLYAAYEQIIAQLASLYEDEQTTEYGFLLNPTIRNTLSAETLFQKREKNGKVVIIHMPVRILEKTDQLPIYLIHEVFHVLTRKQRRRELRAQFLLGNLLNQIGICIFDGVTFDVDENIDLKIKNLLFDKWAGSIKKEYKNEVKGKPPLDRFFYSENISRYMNDLAERWIEEIDNRMIEDVVGGIVYEKLCYMGTKQINMENLIEKAQKIHRNIEILCYNKKILYIINRLLYLFRECYADMACLFTSEYDLQQYNMAFKETVRFKINDEQFEKDDYHKIRQDLMRAVLKNEDLQTDGDYEKSARYGKTTGKDSECCIVISPYLEKTYVRYLRICKEELKKSLKGKDGELKLFKDSVKHLQKMDAGFIQSALLGDINSYKEGGAKE